MPPAVAGHRGDSDPRAAHCLLAYFVSGAVGVWLFYVQHQFEDTYWQAHADWRYDHAALVAVVQMQHERSASAVSCYAKVTHASRCAD